MIRHLRSSVLLVIALASAVRAAEIEGIQYADRIVVHDAPLVVHGVGLLRWKIVFRGYVAALYLGEGVKVQNLFDDVPKRLELEYFWSIPGKAFGDKGDEILAQNVSPETMTALRPRLDRINAGYVDVKPGDRLSLTYVPGVGTELARSNGEVLVKIEGADFAREYFKIWLGEKPMDVSLRDQLLKKQTS